MEWSVELEFPHRMEFTEDLSERVGNLLEVLAPYSAVAAHSRNTLSVRSTVAAPSAEAAITKAKRVVRWALKKVGFRRAGHIVRIEVETMEDLDRRLQESNVPDLVGVAEIAQILKVSRQRASELAKSAGFPHPVATLAAGPVWLRSSISRHLVRWPRRPGRPRKVPSAV